MATINSSSLVLSSSISSSSSSNNKRATTNPIKASINIPRRFDNISLQGLQTQDFHKFVEKQLSPDRRLSPNNNNANNVSDPTVISKLYAILESVADRVEMHKNIGDQRTNWNNLLLTSINSLTLAAATMAGIAAINAGGASAEALKLSSTIMYVAATGMLSIVNKIQPSQLAEEQRNATRLFKQIQNQIQTLISIGKPRNVDVKEMMEKVLAIDRAYPLPLLGVMLEKFPEKVEPAVWWPQQTRRKQLNDNNNYNGWNGKLEKEMREVVKVIGIKDKEDYLRLGSKALKLNKMLAISGPVLTGLAAVGAAFVGSHSHAIADVAVVMGVAGGALASVVNTLEHGGQVGMVFEMYRSNAGFFKMMEESIEANLREDEPERRENGEVFEIKVGLQLGRSLSQLKDLAAASSAQGEHIDEFASKLF